MKKILICILIFIVSIFSFPVLAMDCGQDPIYDRDEKGEVVSAVFVRDWACVSGSKVISTLQAGWVVKITGYTDGWYRIITPDGQEGWSGENFFKITDKSLTSASSNSSNSSNSTVGSLSGLEKYQGYIFLAVQQNGEAYYYYPTDNKKYYLGRPADAFNVMRKLGLGAKHDFITSYEIFPASVSGKILLDVEQNGEAYYIYPKDRKAYYLGRPADAFEIMRELGLGSTDENLGKIQDGFIE